MSRLNSAKLPGHVCGVAAWDAGSPIVVATASYKDGFPSTVVSAVDQEGRVLWQQRFDGLRGAPRLTGAGTAWVAHAGSRGATVSELNSTGEIVSTIVPECDPTEELGEFVVLPDGLLVLWLPTERGGRAVPRRRDARLARHNEDGGTRWSEVLPFRDLVVPGAVIVTVKTGEERPSPPLKPRTVEAGRWDPLLVSGSRAAATIACGDSGIAVTFFVETETGQLIGTTAPGPSGRKAIAGPGEFLLGSQGYGAFHTALYDATGAVTQQWHSHTQMLIDSHGVISGPESQNTSLPQYFVRFDPDGGLQDGPLLSAYYTAYPALDSHGTAVFWRDDALRAVDANLEMRELLDTKQGDRATTSRVLLLGDGHVVFALNDELIIFREPALGSLNDGIWPCGDGGIRNNPVKFWPTS